MQSPRQLLRMCAKRRMYSGKDANTKEDAGPMPAPTAPPRPAPESGHALYAGLMRSHDRLRPRSLA